MKKTWRRCSCESRHKIKDQGTIADRALPLLECMGTKMSDIKHLMHNACNSHIHIYKAGVATVPPSVYRLYYN